MKRKIVIVLSVLMLVLFTGCNPRPATYMSPIGYELYNESGRFVRGSGYIDEANDVLNACRQYQGDRLTEVYLKCIDFVKVEDQARFVDECRDNAFDMVCVGNGRFYEDILNKEKQIEEDLE